MDSTSKAREAIRLRGDGLSLRDIGQQLGVDEKQVRRWLTKAKAPKPSRIRGLDGRDYRSTVSAPEQDMHGTADKIGISLKHNELTDCYLKLEGIQRALTVISKKLRSHHGRATFAQAQKEADEVGRQYVMSQCGRGAGYGREPLWNPEPEEGELHEQPIVDALITVARQFLSPEGLEYLHDELWPWKCPQSEQRAG
jgi:hypothetical protein